MAAVPAIRLPEIDVPKLDRPDVKVREALTGMNLPAIDMPDVNLAGTLADVVAATGVRRPARRSRLPFAIAGLIVAGTAAWAITNSQQLRKWLRDLVASVRERFSSMQSNASDEADPIAFPAAETEPIQPGAWDRRGDVDVPDYPEGLGSRNDDQMLAPEEGADPV